MARQAKEEQVTMSNMHKIIFLLAVTTLAGMAIAGPASQPTSAPVIDRAVLRSEVANFIKAMDRPETGPEDFLKFVELRDRLGGLSFAKEIAAECYRQAVEGKRDLVLAKLLRYENSEEWFAKTVALQGLDSSTQQLQDEAVLWCVSHSRVVDEQTELVVHQLNFRKDRETRLLAEERAEREAPKRILSPRMIQAFAAEYLYALEQERSGKVRYAGVADFFWRLHIRKNRPEIIAECVRQSSEARQDNILAELIRYDDSEATFTKEASLRGLTSTTPELQQASVRWCLRHGDLVDAKAMEQVRTIVRQWAKTANNDHDRAINALLYCAERQDVPLIRGMLPAYESRFAGPIMPKYSYLNVCSDAGIKYADFIWLLCHLGDSTAFHEVADALEQKEDAGKRVWGILMAVRMWPQGFFETAVADALSDKTSLPVAVAMGPPPGVSNEVARFTSIESYTRVCDLAVRAIFDMEPPAKPWPFDVPSAKGWRLLDVTSEKGISPISDDGFEQSKAGAITSRRTVGFSDDRIAWTKDYVRKCQEKRLARAQSGSSPQIGMIGIEDGVAKALVQEYVKAGQVARLVHTTATSDVTGVGVFVGEHPPDILLLSDRPSDMAMKIHGEKWNALGRDESGKLNGAGPAEYLLAGRATAIIVNPANKLESLTLEQIRAIFGGEVNDWAVVGGTGLTAPPAGAGGSSDSIAGGSSGAIKINCLGLSQYDTAGQVFYKECLSAEKLKGVTLKKDTAEALAAVSMDPQAIAFVDLASIPAGGQNVKVLGIQMNIRRTGVSPVESGATAGTAVVQILPSPENIGNAMYPLSQRLFMYVHPKASETAKDFIAFITSVLCREGYRKSGLIPLSEAAITRMLKDAEAAKVVTAGGKSGG